MAAIAWAAPPDQDLTGVGDRNVNVRADVAAVVDDLQDRRWSNMMKNQT